MKITKDLKCCGGKRQLIRITPESMEVKETHKASCNVVKSWKKVIGSKGTN